MGKTQTTSGCWGDDVPEGEVTSFPMAVKSAPDETVVFSWIHWPSRSVRDEGWLTRACSRTRTRCRSTASA